jgi:hypothetical protein
MVFGQAFEPDGCERTDKDHRRAIMQFLAFALGRFPDPFAIILGSAIGILSRAWWQTILGGLTGGAVMALAFGWFGGVSGDVALYFLVDVVVVAAWASFAFAIRSVLRRLKPT